MAKRGYKLQEFVAHSANVNCVKIGKKTHRNFITGGDDEKVNLWSIGKPTSITSLSGHTSPIESVAFDSTELLVAAGASSGVIKLWDLEETKLVRTLNGHRSYCTAVEFHPFGEFFASGSMDTNLKIWDIRKKGCIHTYKGHKRAISSIRFSPDGRWVVSGGLDNVVKIWDLTAGKLLHEFKFHEGHIRSIEFHPLEFLLATGSSDRTVKFWDLETFELIGSTRAEPAGVRSVTFHPDGRTLFCGLDSSLKVYSWEPVICHDTVEMGWSTLGDLCIDDGKLLGCSYYQNSVGVWVADISHIEPHRHGMLVEKNTHVQPKTNLQKNLKERAGSPRRSSISPDDDAKDIKNIYVDTAGMTTVASRKANSLPTVVNLPNSKEMDNLAMHKQVAAAKIIEQVHDNSLSMPGIVPDAKDSVKPRRESIVSGQGSTGVSVKPPHRRTLSTTRLNTEGLPVTVESLSKGGPDVATSMNFPRRPLADDAAKDCSAEKALTSTRVVKETQRASTPQENGDGSVDSNKGLESVKYVNGVAVVRGRTRSLVEKFEKREKPDTEESQIPSTDMPAVKIPEAKISPIRVKIPSMAPCAESDSESKTSQMPVKTPDVVSCPVSGATTLTMPVRGPGVISRMPTEAKTALVQVKTPDGMPSEEPESKTPQMLSKMPDVVAYAEPDAKTPQTPVSTPDMVSYPVSEDKTSFMPVRKPDVISRAETEAKTSAASIQTPDSGLNMKSEDVHSYPVLVVQRPKTAPSILPEKTKASSLRRTVPSMLPEKAKASSLQRSATARRVIPEKVRSSPVLVVRRSSSSTHLIPERTKTSSLPVVSRHDSSTRMIPDMAKTSQLRVSRHNTPTRTIPDMAKTSPLRDENPQTTGREMTSKNNEDDVCEDLMQNHDVFLSTLQSRVTKLQVVRHFWERNDMKGAINALRKLPDHAVQADVVGVMMENMGSLTLDLFSVLLPVLLGLLDSNTERHVSVSLEMLLKLVAVFGPVVSSTISAPPAMGVDLHAEKRLECCNQCHMELQKIQKSLPAIIRRGGLAARCAQELNLILQQS